MLTNTYIWNTQSFKKFEKVKVWKFSHLKESAITFAQGCRTANMSWRTCVVVKQIQSNPNLTPPNTPPISHSTLHPSFTPPIKPPIIHSTHHSPHPYPLHPSLTPPITNHSLHPSPIIHSTHHPPFAPPITHSNHHSIHPLTHYQSIMLVIL